MEAPAVHYAILRDRRQWIDGLELSNLQTEADGTTSLIEAATEGTLQTQVPLDAGEFCSWSRVTVTAGIPSGTFIELFYTVGEDGPANEEAWGQPRPLDSLIRQTPAKNSDVSGPNRYLWLRVRLRREETASGPSAQLLQVQAQTAGENYLDYLPALYRSAELFVLLMDLLERAHGF